MRSMWHAQLARGSGEARAMLAYPAAQRLVPQQIALEVISGHEDISAIPKGDEDRLAVGDGRR